MSLYCTPVSGALVQERETLKNDNKITQQVPIYFVSEALTNSKRYYSEMEKICYVVVMSARKLRHFQSIARMRTTHLVLVAATFLVLVLSNFY
jgi:hypothetical protein